MSKAGAAVLLLLGLALVPILRAQTTTGIQGRRQLGEYGVDALARQPEPDIP